MDMDAYKALHFQVKEERNRIISKLNQGSEAASSVKPSQIEKTDLLSFLSRHESLAIRDEVLAVFNELTEIDQLWNSLFISLRQYPDFSLEASSNDPNYVHHLHDELHEHHTEVTMLADEYFRCIEILKLSVRDYSNSPI